MRIINLKLSCSQPPAKRKTMARMDIKIHAESSSLLAAADAASKDAKSASRDGDLASESNKYCSRGRANLNYICDIFSLG
jgi:hypothetical protein